VSTELTVVARMQAKPDRIEPLRAALDAMITATRREEGCINYDLHVHADDPTVFVFHETWADRAAWEAHNDAPHIEDFRARAGELLDGPVQVDPLHRLD
jgi:quinol monooxygenase YgiN